MTKSAKVSLLTGAACAVMWLPLWLGFNFILAIAAFGRGDPTWSTLLGKEVFAPAVAAWASFSIAAHFTDREAWRLSFGVFALFVVSLAVLQSWWNAEYYLTAGRVVEFRRVIAWSALGFVAALIAGAATAWRRWGKQR